MQYHILKKIVGNSLFFTPVAKGHGLCPWMNAPSFGRDVAPLGREVGCHGLYPWGSTIGKLLGEK